jgi:hypothetical protein
MSQEIPLSKTGPTTPLNVPMSDIYVQVDTSEMEARLGQLAHVIPTAAKRAAVRTRDWLMTQLRRELSRRAAVPRKELKGRFRRSGGEKGSAYSRSAYAVLWIGLNGIEAQKVGNPRQNKTGTKVGRHSFDRAFLSTIYSGEQKIWRRKSFGRGSRRFPVVKMTIPVNEAMEEILPEYQAAAARMFSQRLEHEVNYLLGLS